MSPVERRHRHDRARTLHTRLSGILRSGYQLCGTTTTRKWSCSNEPRSRRRTSIMHQDLRVVIRIIQSRADARSPGQQRAPEGDDRCYPQHDTELGLLPPRPGRRGHMARALHHAGRGRGPVIGAALGRGPHRRELGRRFAQVHACRAKTGHAVGGRRRRGRLVRGPERTAPGRDPWDVYFCYFKYSGCGIFAWCLGSKSGCCIVISGQNT